MGSFSTHVPSIVASGCVALLALGAAAPELAAQSGSAAPQGSAASLAGCPSGKLDDFDGALIGTIASCEGRAGSWYTFNDGAALTRQTPAPGQRVEQVSAGPAGVGRAMRTFGVCELGRPSPALWGAAIAVDLDNPGPGAIGKRPYDAAGRGFVGVRFKARVGDTPGAVNVVVFSVPDVNTDPSGGRCSDCAGDAVGACQPCHQYHSMTLHLTRQWQWYTVLWRELGSVGATPFAGDGIVSLQWRFAAGDTFDLYLDDVELVR